MNSDGKVIMNNYQRGKPSQHWALVDQQIKWLYDTGESTVVGIKPPDFCRSGCNLFCGPLLSLTCAEWVQDFVEINRWVSWFFLVRRLDYSFCWNLQLLSKKFECTGTKWTSVIAFCLTERQLRKICMILRFLIRHKFEVSLLHFWTWAYSKNFFPAFLLN